MDNNTLFETDDQSQELFDYWKETFNKRSTTVFDEARRKKVDVALRNYSMEICKKAIKGCSLSAWHSGQNPNNKKYNDLSLIFRNADKVEYFVDICDQEAKGEQEMEEWLNS
jgi:hypothetical protein